MILFWILFRAISLGLVASRFSAAGSNSSAECLGASDTVFCRVCRVLSRCVWLLKSGWEGFEAIGATSLLANELHKSLNSVDVKSGALGGKNGTLPPDLQLVVSAWPALSEGDRQNLLALVREATAKAGKAG